MFQVHYVYHLPIDHRIHWAKNIVMFEHEEYATHDNLVHSKNVEIVNVT